MPDAQQIRDVIAEYCRRFADDREGWLALWADDATIEDPVGSDVQRGKDAIAGFWDMAHELSDSVTLTPSDFVKVVGNEAAFAMTSRMETGGTTSELRIIDVMTFDDDARITSQRAYWSFDDLTAV